MPIMLTRKDGPPTPFRNAEYIPFYYFIPKSILSRCGAELNAIPRNPQELFHNRAACEFVESDLFRLLIIDATAFMVWPYMGFGEYMEIYSGYDPAWRFAHCRTTGSRNWRTMEFWHPPANYSKVATRRWAMYRNGRSTSICATLCPM